MVRAKPAPTGHRPATDLAASSAPVRRQHSYPRFHGKEKADTQNLTYVTLDFGQNILPQIMQVLYERKIQTLLVEGGSQTLQSFLEQGLWDEAFIEHAQVSLHDGIPAPTLPCGQESRFFFRDGALVQHCRHAE